MPIKTAFLAILGLIFLGLGAIGLLLPVLPTTPFVLLSAACFSHTPRLRRWIMGISFFKNFMENYSHRTGLSRRTVIISLSYLWGMLLLSMLLTGKLWIILLLSTIGLAVTLHILYMAKAKNTKGGFEP